MFKDWKTSTAGVAAILAAAAHLATAVAAGDYSTLGADVPVILAGLVGIFAKDSSTPEKKT
jgi:hypothetical protein